MVLREMEWEAVDLMHLDQDKDYYRALVNTEISL
jgi:hypothetical protein